jgi:hypothetical protein
LPSYQVLKTYQFDKKKEKKKEEKKNERKIKCMYPGENK